MGKGAAKQSQQIASQAANNFGSLATNLQAGAAPAIKASQDYYSAILKGGPAAYTAVAPQAEFTKQQFANARRQLQDTAPAGGFVPAAKTALAQGEAQTISGLYKANIDNAVQNLTQLGEFGTTAGETADTGLTGVSQSLAQLSASRLAAITGGIGGIAGALGTYFGLKKPAVT